MSAFVITPEIAGAGAGRILIQGVQVHTLLFLINKLDGIKELDRKRSEN